MIPLTVRHTVCECRSGLRSSAVCTRASGGTATLWLLREWSPAWPALRPPSPQMGCLGPFPIGS